MASKREILIIRHGATRLNNDDTSVDRIRGWKDIPLSEEGRKEAHRLAGKVARLLPDVIVCSNLKRAVETAEIVAKRCQLKVAEKTKAFRPWNVGKFAGELSSKAVPVLVEYAEEAPNEKVPDGESFNQFKLRLLTGLSDALAKYEGLLAIVTHHRDERLLHAWKEAGFSPEGELDMKEFGKKGEPTGGLSTLEVPLSALNKAVGNTEEAS